MSENGPKADVLQISYQTSVPMKLPKQHFDAQLSCFLQCTASLRILAALAESQALQGQKLSLTIYRERDRKLRRGVADSWSWRAKYAFYKIRGVYA